MAKSFETLLHSDSDQFVLSKFLNPSSELLNIADKLLSLTIISQMCIQNEMVDSQHGMQHQVSNNHLISNKEEHEPTGECFHNFI